MNTDVHAWFKVNGAGEEAVRTRHRRGWDYSGWFPDVDLLSCVLTRDDHGKQCWNPEGGFASSDDVWKFTCDQCPIRFRDNVSVDCLEPELFWERMIGQLLDNPIVWVELLYSHESLLGAAFQLEDFLSPKPEAVQKGRMQIVHLTRHKLASQQ